MSDVPDWVQLAIVALVVVFILVWVLPAVEAIILALLVAWLLSDE